MRRANPGGSISASEMVGREPLIEHIWSALERQSLVLLAERRLGKTTIVKAIRDQPRPGFVAVYRDVEGLRVPLELVDRLREDLGRVIGGRWMRRLGDAVKSLGGAEIGGLVKLPEAIAPHWKTLLEGLIADLSTARGDRRIVLIWDELPLMLQKVRDTTGARDAEDVLDALRTLRQMHPWLRMVFTGSIGLHHVTSALRAQGAANDATNDMLQLEIPPLRRPDAERLAAELLAGERVRCEDLSNVASTIAIEVEGHPYLIHHVVSDLSQRERIDAESVRAAVAERLVDPQDPWHLDHFRDRLGGYYGRERERIALAILDTVAVTEPAASVDGVARTLTTELSPSHGDLAAAIVDGDREPLLRLLTALERDHYLSRRPVDGAYRFKLDLLRRWWVRKRGLLR